MAQVGSKLSFAGSVFCDNPYRMDYARNIAKKRQKDINPKMLPKPHLQEHPQGRQKDRDHDAQQIHLKPPYLDLPT
jgi:hypothetical protein